MLKNNNNESGRHTQKNASWNGRGGRKNSEEVVQVRGQSLYRAGAVGVMEVKRFLRSLGGEADGLC